MPLLKPPPLNPPLNPPPTPQLRMLAPNFPMHGSLECALNLGKTRGAQCMMCRDLHPTCHKVMLDPYEPEDAQRSLGPYTPPAREEGGITQAAPAGEIVGGAKFGLGECAANHLCRPPKHQNIECVLCINCNKTAHKLCTELLFFQSPVPDEHVIAVTDWGVGGKGWLHLPHLKDRVEFYFCILC